MNKQDAALFGGALFTTIGVVYGIKKAKGFLFFLLVFTIIGGLGSQLGWAIGKRSEENKELENELKELAKQK